MAQQVNNLTITEDQIRAWTFSKLCSKLSQSPPWHPINTIQQKIPFSNTFKTSKTMFGSGECSSRPNDLSLPFDVKISLFSNLLIVADHENLAIKFFDLESKELKAIYKMATGELVHALCVEYCRFTRREFLYVSFEGGKIEKYYLKELVEYCIVTFPIFTLSRRKKQKPSETIETKIPPPIIKEITPIWTCTTVPFPFCMVVRYGKYENLLYVASEDIPVISCSTGSVVQYCLEHKDWAERSKSPIILPYGIDLIEDEGKACRLVISDNNKQRVAILEEDSSSQVWKFIRYIKDDTNEDDGFSGAVGLIHDRLNGQLICLDQEGCRLKVYSKDGSRLIKVFSPPKIVECYYSFQPRSLDLDYRTGHLVVADTFNNVIRLFK